MFQVALRLRGAISSKQLGYEDLLSPLIAESCIDVVPTNPVNFNVDNVRIVKIMGGALPDSKVGARIFEVGARIFDCLSLECVSDQIMEALLGLAVRGLVLSLRQLSLVTGTIK